jgi:hypothetical protein
VNALLILLHTLTSALLLSPQNRSLLALRLFPRAFKLSLPQHPRTEVLAQEENILGRASCYLSSKKVCRHMMSDPCKRSLRLLLIFIHDEERHKRSSKTVGVMVNHYLAIELPVSLTSLSKSPQRTSAMCYRRSVYPQRENRRITNIRANANKQ